MGLVLIFFNLGVYGAEGGGGGTKQNHIQKQKQKAVDKIVEQQRNKL